jgi:hypothetical protein
MEDKGKEELRDKTDKINNLKRRIGTYKNLMEEVNDMLEFLDTVQPQHISLKGYSDNGGCRENILMPLHDNDIKAVKDLVKKKLIDQITEYDDEISKAYQNLDELLK